MATFAPQTAAAVAAAYDFSGVGASMDVGGGNGALLIGILNANPGVRGIVFDRPHVAERARKEVAAHGLELYTGAGFELTRIVPTPARVAVIEGAPA